MKTIALPDFKKGDRVLVDNERYHGPGIVGDNTQYGSRFVIKGADELFVAVLLENGNTWLYEVDTVRAAR
jgi:hypothetical protein